MQTAGTGTSFISKAQGENGGRMDGAVDKRTEPQLLLFWNMIAT